MNDLPDDFIRHVREHLVPRISDTNVMIALHTGTVDVKFALELGVCVLLDKPLFACVRPGTPVPEKLAKIADKFIELSDDPQVTANRMRDAIQEWIEERGDAT